MIDSHLEERVPRVAVVHRAVQGGARANGRLQGSIINVSSTYGVVSPDQSVYDYRRRGGHEYYKPVGYSVAKSGVLNFTRWLAEYARAVRRPREHARPGRRSGSRITRRSSSPST